MKRTTLSWGGCLGVAVAWLVGCSIDERTPTVGVPSLLPEAGAPGSGNGGSPGGGPGGMPNVGLTVVPSSVELGAVTQGFAARARLRVSNSGSNPLAAPAVAWASGSDADLSLIQNLCTAELAPGQECDLRVQVVPSRVGAVQGTLEVASATAGTVVLPVTASGLEPGPLLLQPATGSFQDFGGVRVGVAAEGTFTVSNPGAVASGVLSLSFNRPEFAPAPAVAGECVPGVTELASGQSCDFRVAFTPAERGAIEATLSVTSGAAGSRSLTLRGRGLVPAVLSVSAPLLSFGGVVPGDTASLDLELENRGDEALTLASPQLLPADIGVFRIADGNCGEGVVLTGGQRCRVQLDYRPVEEGEPSAGELLVAAQGGQQSERIALQGVALTRGNLAVEALEAGQEDFGDVRLGQSVSRVFRVSNPSQQASGVLSLTARNGFEIQPSGEAGACEAGVTELGNAQSCTVRVSFAPSSRGPRAGALTVDSPLAGARSLALRGRGISAGVLEADTGAEDAVVDFGRVTAGSSASRTITVRNGGDELLPVPALRVTGSSPSQAAAFRYESGCTQPLAAEGQCEIVLGFAPEAAVPYAASLELMAASGQPSGVLLLGEALEPGRLALAPADGASPDFGDVEVGATVTRSFSVTNPGGGASGALSVRTDDSQFVVSAEACAQAGAAGLADGESCTFEVSFTPTTNIATAARLSVQSAVSGETGIALSGRGRLPAALAATTTERDLGRANLGQPSGPANQFTWTVNNGGDLPSGALSVSNDNSADFDVAENTCSSGPVAGGGSCSLTVVFAPDNAGDRSARITVADAASGQSVPLQVTGFGVLLAAPGERCLATSDCQAGVCTAGVCCNQACNLTCQSCATGQCLAQDRQEPCGNGGGVCFGVEQCQLPAGGGCSDSSQCGGNLVCKACRFGGSQCTAPDACCGGCAAGYQCVEGECGCPFQANGLRQIDCGGGVCALNRVDACCPSSPPAGCNCDPTDNLCKECLQNSHCTNGPANSVGQCTTNRTCSYTCQPGFKSCNGGCIPNAACCGGCGAQQECINGQCRIDDGATCSAGGAPCASGNCSSGRCCPVSCGAGGCNAQGSCACNPGFEFARGACRRSNGQSCNPANDDCANGCTSWSEDVDGDGFGNQFGPLRSVCGPTAPPSNVRLVADRRDCCDASEQIRPNQQGFFNDISIGNGCPADWLSLDFNCNGTLESQLPPTQFSSCEGPAGTPCQQRSGIWVGEGNFLGLTAADVTTQAGLRNVCANSSAQYSTCTLEGTECVPRFALAPPCR